MTKDKQIEKLRDKEFEKAYKEYEQIVNSRVNWPYELFPNKDEDKSCAWFFWSKLKAKLAEKEKELEKANRLGHEWFEGFARKELAKRELKKENSTLKARVKELELHAKLDRKLIKRAKEELEGK